MSVAWETVTGAAWDESKHPRHEAGSPEGGEFRKLYHVTPVQNRAAIRSQGLRVDAAKRYQDFKDQGVFVWDSFENAWKYATTGERMYGDFDIWETTEEGLTLEPDPFFQDRESAKARAGVKMYGDQGALLSRESIPADRLKLRFGSPWYPDDRFASLEEVQGSNESVMMEVREDDDAIQLDAIFSTVKGEGHASMALDDLIAYADAKGKPIYLTPEQADDEEGSLSTAQLKEWYKRHGFTRAKRNMEDLRYSHTWVYRPRLTAAGWDEEKHPRHPKGTPVEGGRFSSKTTVEIGQIVMKGEGADAKVFHAGERASELPGEIMAWKEEEPRIYAEKAYWAAKEPDNNLIVVRRDGELIGVGQFTYMGPDTDLVGGYFGAVKGGGLPLFNAFLEEAEKRGVGASWEAGNDRAKKLYDRLNIPHPFAVTQEEYDLEADHELYPTFEDYYDAWDEEFGFSYRLDPEQVRILAGDMFAFTRKPPQGPEEDEERRGMPYPPLFSSAVFASGAPWDEAKHPRQPAGSERGGEFASSRTTEIEVAARWESLMSDQLERKNEMEAMWKADAREGMTNDFDSDYWRFWADENLYTGGQSSLPMDWAQGHTFDQEDVVAVDNIIRESRGIREDTAVWRGAYNQGGDPSLRPISTSFSKYSAIAYADRTGGNKEDHLHRVVIPAGTKVGWHGGEDEVVLPSGTRLERKGRNLWIARVPPDFIDPVMASAWVEADHPRHPEGVTEGGQFAPKGPVGTFKGVPKKMMEGLSAKKRRELEGALERVSALPIPEPNLSADYGITPTEEQVSLGGFDFYRSTGGAYHLSGPMVTGVIYRDTPEEIVALADELLELRAEQGEKAWAARLRGKTYTDRNSPEVMSLFKLAQEYNYKSDPVNGTAWADFAAEWELDEQPIILNEAGTKEMGKDVLTSGWYDPENDNVFISGDMWKIKQGMDAGKRYIAEGTTADLIGPMVRGGFSGGHTAPGLLRHEYAHKQWARLTQGQRDEFLAMVPLELDTIGQGLTGYAAASKEYYGGRSFGGGIFPWQGEVYAEAVAATLDPGYRPGNWPDWVNEMGDWIKRQRRHPKGSPRGGQFA